MRSSLLHLLLLQPTRCHIWILLLGATGEEAGRPLCPYAGPSIVQLVCVFPHSFSGLPWTCHITLGPLSGPSSWRKLREGYRVACICGQRSQLSPLPMDLSSLLPPHPTPSPSPSPSPPVRLTATRKSWSRSWSCPSSSSAARSSLASLRRKKRRTRRGQGQPLLKTPACLSPRCWVWAVMAVNPEDLAHVPCLLSLPVLGTTWRTCLA